MSWKTVTIGDVCTIVNGGTPKSEVSEYWDGDLNWITPKEMGKLTSREITSTERKITEKGIKNSSAKLLPINSVILSSRAPIGHLAINKSLMATNQGCKGLVPSEKLNYEYLYYFLSRSKQLLNDMGSGATFKELSGSKLATVEIPLPPLVTQQKIVAKLDAIFAEIDKATATAEANAKNAEALFKSYLSKVLTANSEEWKTVSFGEVLVKTENINPEKEPSRVFQYVDVSSISKELLKISEPQRILGKDAPSRARKLIKKDDVLFATVRPTLRRIALVPEELDGEVCSTGYFVLRSNGEILQKFIFYSLLRSEFMDVMEKIQTGASYPAVNDKQVLEQIISFPSLDVQRLKVTKLDSISEEVKKSFKSYTEKINEFTTLKQSILRKAFAGELVKE